MSKYLIIGNSAAAIGCIEGIRQIDQTGDITVVSGEGHHTYSRPLISYLLYGKTNLEKMKYRPDNFYEKNGCQVILGQMVVKIDKEQKLAYLSDGRSIGYEKLLIATGSKPFIPPMQGLETVDCKFTFMSLDDAQALEKSLTPDSRVLIVGAGLIGLKCAEGIAHLVKSITIVDMADRILSSILDGEGAALVQKHIESKGITFMLSDSVAQFQGDVAILKSGAQVGFDCLVLAVGVVPNTGLMADMGGKVNRGIVTDLFCATSIPDVYAAGDCTESLDIVSGQSRVLALLPNAYMQGECAGINMAGGSKMYDKAIAMNAIGFFGLHMITAGSYEGQAEIVPHGDGYKKLFVKDGLLKGYILIGDVCRAGIYTALIRNKTPLESIDFELMKQKPQLMAFSKMERAKQLGGVK